MKILLYQPYGQREGHFAMYTCYLGQELALKGHDVTVVAAGLDPKPYLGGRWDFHIKGLPLSAMLKFQRRTFSLEGIIRGASLIWDNFRLLVYLGGLLKGTRSEAVYFLDYEPVSTASVLWVWKSILRRPLPPLFFVIHAPDTSVHGHGNPVYKWYNRASRPMMKALVRNFASGVLAHGDWNRGELEEALGLAGKKPPIFYAPLGPMIRERPVPAGEARKKLGIDYPGRLLLFFGVLRKDKGIDVLIRAMARVKGECRLLIAGLPFDWSREEIQKQVRLNGAEEKFILDLNYIPQEKIHLYFSAADAVVYPYRNEHLGAVGSLSSVLVFNKAIIASRVRELDRYLSGSPSSYLAEPEDEGSLAGAIENFLGHGSPVSEDKAQRTGREARAGSWAAVAEIFSEAGAHVSNSTPTEGK